MSAWSECWCWRKCLHLPAFVGASRGALASTLTAFFASHPHLDHCADALFNGARRHGLALPVPFYATRATWEHGVGRHFPYLAGADPSVEWREIPETTIHSPWGVDLGLGVGLRVTAVPVWHGSTAPGAVIFVIEFNGCPLPKRHKLILAWDLLHLVPRYEVEDHDARYQPPPNAPDVSGGKLTAEHAALFFGTDVLLLEGNTRHPNPQTGHTSIDAGLRFLVPQIGARVTRFVHFSGHEDPGGALADNEVNSWLAGELVSRGLSKMDLRMARHGETFTFNAEG